MPPLRRQPLALLIACSLVFPRPGVAQDRAAPSLGDQIRPLVAQLAAPTEAARDRARQRLLDLAGPGSAEAERVLDALPTPGQHTPPALREPLLEIRRAISDRLAELAAQPSRVTLNVVQAPLSAVLAEIEKQTGNRVIDLREQFGQDAKDRPVTIDVTDAPFWDAMDRVLDEAGLSVYSFSGARALGLVGRGQQASARWASACYAGPMRVEPVRVTASRNLRSLRGESLNVQLEVSWEPRLAPIALKQPLDAIVAVDERGGGLPVARPGGTIDMEVQTGSQAVELTLPLELPGRGVNKIRSLRGELLAVAPSQPAEFRFAGLDKIAGPVVKQRGGATVTVDAVRKNNDIWEVRMRLRIDGADAPTNTGAQRPDRGETPFASHRGWVFENPSLLVGEDGREIDNAGFETTMQRGNEIGLAYLFDLPDGVGGLTWVYRTPTAILRFPLPYEVNHIRLP